MLWYDGNIAEAVALSKQRNAIFVVFVEGEDEQSVELAQVIDAAPVESCLKDQNSFLAVKLKSGSDTYLQFARIYQLVPVPSLFFIGRTGAPLEVVCAGVTAETLAERIERILRTHKSDPSLQLSTPAQNARAQTSSFLQAEAATQPSTSGSPCASAATKRPSAEKDPAGTDSSQKTTTSDNKDYEVVCDGDVCVKRPKTGHSDPGPSGVNKPPEGISPSPPSPQPSTADVSEEERVARAKALIEARRREQAEKEKELEKQREIERRNTGKSVAELKRWQADEELKHIQEERKREKMENNLARQRILEQIAQDRVERRARDLPAAPSTQPAPQTQPASSSGGDATGRTRIQFKLPDGQSHTAHFDSGDTLATVTQYIANNLNLSPSQFSLWTAFPRRELCEAGASLRSLQLAPSAALLVMLNRQARTDLAQPSAFANAIDFLMQLFSRFIVYPCQCSYEWLRNAVWGGPPPAPARRSASPPPAVRDDAPRPVRRIANIHRLSPDRGADDENNTWNGNSTQQM